MIEKSNWLSAGSQSFHETPTSITVTPFAAQASTCCRNRVKSRYAGSQSHIVKEYW